MLQLDESVKKFTQERLDANPQIEDKEAVEYIDFKELKKVINTNNKNKNDNLVRKITILRELQPICKNSEIYGKEQPKIETISNLSSATTTE